VLTGWSAFREAGTVCRDVPWRKPAAERIEGCLQKHRAAPRTYGSRDRESLMDRTGVFIAAFDGAREGALELRRGGSHVAIRAGESDVLCRAAFDGRAPKTWAEDGRVTIEYPRFSFAGLLRRPVRRAQIELNAALPWSLAVVGGLADSILDLGGLELRVLELKGGVADLRIVLPPPSGRVRVRIGGGADKLTLLRPPEVAAVLQIAGGASRLAFDGERYGAIGGETRLETPNAGSNNDRYEIEIGGGASRVTVAQSDEGGE
jgi:hypothetical protein